MRLWRNILISRRTCVNADFDKKCVFRSGLVSVLMTPQIYRPQILNSVNNKIPGTEYEIDLSICKVTNAFLNFMLL